MTARPTPSPGFDAHARQMAAIHMAAREQLALNAIERGEQMRAYRVALEEAPWGYEMADVHSTWREGREHFTHLYDLQAEVDPTGAMWLRYSAGKFNAPQPRVRAAS